MENHGLNFVKTDEEVFYFNYKSMPDQVIEFDAREAWELKNFLICFNKI